jgi:hypothetical protein
VEIDSWKRLGRVTAPKSALRGVRLPFSEATVMGLVVRVQNHVIFQSVHHRALVTVKDVLLPLNYPGIILNLHPGIEALICSWL